MVVAVSRGSDGVEAEAATTPQHGAGMKSGRGGVVDGGGVPAFKRPSQSVREVRKGLGSKARKEWWRNNNCIDGYLAMDLDGVPASFSLVSPTGNERGWAGW